MSLLGSELHFAHNLPYNWHLSQLCHMFYLAYKSFISNHPRQQPDSCGCTGEVPQFIKMRLDYFGIILFIV
jgi:hypothetical protein